MRLRRYDSVWWNVAKLLGDPGRKKLLEGVVTPYKRRNWSKSDMDRFRNSLQPDPNFAYGWLKTVLIAWNNFSKSFNSVSGVSDFIFIRHLQLPR